MVTCGWHHLDAVSTALSCGVTGANCASRGAHRCRRSSINRWKGRAAAAGAISGVVRSKSGRILVVKGGTYKDKVRKTEFTEDEDGNITEMSILTDRFIPIIRAWEMTPSSINQGRVLTISSSAATTVETEEPQPEPAPHRCCSGPPTS